MGRGETSWAAVLVVGASIGWATGKPATPQSAGATYDAATVRPSTPALPRSDTTPVQTRTVDGGQGGGIDLESRRSALVDQVLRNNPSIADLARLKSAGQDDGADPSVSLYEPPSHAARISSGNLLRLRSSSGALYQYDLSNPVDQLRYSTDLHAQMRDSLSVDPRRELDRSMQQYGGGISH